MKGLILSLLIISVLVYSAPAELNSSPLPGLENLSLPVDRPVLESCKFISENRTVMQQSDNNSNTPEQGKTKAQVSKT